MYFSNISKCFIKKQNTNTNTNTNTDPARNKCSTLSLLAKITLGLHNQMNFKVVHQSHL